MRRPTIAAIARALDAEAAGDTERRIAGLAEPAAAGPGDLALAMAPKYAEALGKGGARAAVLWPGADWRGLGLEAAIFAPRPRLALAGLTRALDPGPDIAPGIHPTAVIDPAAEPGEGAAIGPFAVIGPEAMIGPDARIGAHATIGRGARIGDGCILGAGAHIGAGAAIGARFIAGPGAVIGADGLSFTTARESRVEAVRGAMAEAEGEGPQPWVRIHSLGAVTIGDDVEIGANAAIDRGTIRDTRIGDGTKIDNLVHVAHNVCIGSDCLFAALVGIAGSTVIGTRVVLGGQVGVVDNITVGDDVVAGGGTKILSNVPPGRAILGYPAMRMEANVEIYKHLRRLPRLAAEVARLKKAVSKTGGSD